MNVEYVFGWNKSIIYYLSPPQLHELLMDYMVRMNVVKDASCVFNSKELHSFASYLITSKVVKTFTDDKDIIKFVFVFVCLKYRSISLHSIIMNPVCACSGCDSTSIINYVLLEESRFDQMISCYLRVKCDALCHFHNENVFLASSKLDWITFKYKNELCRLNDNFLLWYFTYYVLLYALYHIVRICDTLRAI